MNDIENMIGVIDIETSGWLKSGGKIVEIGIAGLDLDTGKVVKLFDSVCREPGLNAQDRDAWIFSNSTLSVEEVREAPLLEDLREEVQEILLSTKANTAFNQKFDFSFLESRGFDTGTAWPCPMLRSTDYFKLPGAGSSYKWPKVQEAWDILFPEIDYKEEHRGYDDAEHEARIVWYLHLLGLMSP